MKKLITIILAIIAISAAGQNNIPVDTVKTLLSSDWVFVKSYNLYTTNPNLPSIKKDSIVFEFPENKLLDKRKIEVVRRFEQRGDTLIDYTENVQFKLTYNRRLLLYQKVNTYVNTIQQKPEADVLLYLLKWGENKGLTNIEFFNNQYVRQIIQQNDSIQ